MDLIKNGETISLVRLWCKSFKIGFANKHAFADIIRITVRCLKITF
jgi:hypothetical protein